MEQGTVEFGYVRQVDAYHLDLGSGLGRPLQTVEIFRRTTEAGHYSEIVCGAVKGQRGRSGL